MVEGSSSSSEPPDNNEEPEDQNYEDNVPEPSTALSGRHVIHASKGTSKDA
jgi:hypothetical protein